MHRFFLSIFKGLREFLFPKSSKVIILEALSSSQLSNILPRSDEADGDIIALFDYGHLLTKEVVWQIKYVGNKNLVEKVGVIVYDTLIDELNERNIFEKLETVILMPVPISDKRRFERGWNQSELLASAIKSCDKAMQFKYLPRQLAKMVHSESQTKTGSRAERLANLKNTMEVLNPETVRGRLVVLVDDVTTTGATFAEGRRALRFAGAKKIICIALAH